MLEFLPTSPQVKTLNFGFMVIFKDPHKSQTLQSEASRVSDQAETTAQP